MSIGKEDKKVTEILRHRITYWYDEFEGELPECEEEYIKAQLIEGYWSGELHYTDEDDNEYRGWWEIEREKRTVYTPWYSYSVTDAVRCNNCRNIFEDGTKKCSNCGTDEYFEQPFMQPLPSEYKYLLGNVHELAEKEETTFVYDGQMYHIFLRGDGDYEVNVYEYELDSDDSTIKHLDEGGVCTGTAVDAVLFLLPTTKPEEAKSGQEDTGC